MKFTSIKSISLFLAVFTSLLSCIFLVIPEFFGVGYKYLYIIFVCLFLFVSLYILFVFVLNKFIVNRIKPIYKTIDSIKIPEHDFLEINESNDIIYEINNEVAKWAKRKAKEISILKENERYRKEFLGNVSHELKTPLFNIQGYVLTLLDGGIGDDSVNIKYLQRTEQNINRLISIVKDLEKISSLESGELKLDLEKFNLILVIEEVFELHERLAAEKKIQMQIIDKPKNTIMVKADKTRIFEMFSNLIVNSIIYGKSEGLTTVQIFDRENKYWVEVTDNGIGIEEKDIKRVFERFYRADKSRNLMQGGSGLGLSIVKHIIEAHNETINVRSKINQGTTFGFSLKKAKENF